MKKEWKATGRGNFVLQPPGEILLSYNPGAQDAMADVMGLLIGLKGSGTEETALKIKGVWYILEGDFRKEYEEAYPDSEALLEVYKANIEHRSEWSTDRLHIEEERE